MTKHEISTWTNANVQLCSSHESLYSA